MRFAVLAAALLGTPALAQVPAAAPDSTTRIFNDVFIGQPAPPAYVTLAGGIVYRVEVEPATAQLSVRMARRASLPPLFLVPLGDASRPAGGAAFLLVPGTSAEYRLDVTTGGDEPVRVRIELDPKENARWARMREETRDRPPAGISVHAVFFGPFRAGESMSGDSLATAAGLGVESCLALLPHSAWLKEAFGGCVVFVTLLRRGNTAGNVVLFGTAPRIEISRWEDGGTLSITLQLALGQTTSGPVHTINLFMVSACGLVSRPVPLTGRRLLAELEFGLASMQGSTNSNDARVYWVPRLGAGLQFGF